MRNWMLLVLVFVTALSACAPAGAGNPAAGNTVPSASASKPQVFTRALTSEPSGLDPQGAAGSGQNVILPYLFDTLVYRDMDNSYKPFLAEKWDITPDGKQATFTLKKGIVFSDGTPLNAEAVKFTFERLMKQGQKSVIASMVTNLISVEAVNDLTVRFTFKTPSSNFMSSLANPYAGIASPTAVQKAGDAFPRQPVGSGPFVLDKWIPGVSITLKPNPKYAWAVPVVKNQGAPKLDQVVFKIIPDVTQQISAYQAGEVDVLFVNQPSHVAKLKADPDTNLVETTLNSLIYLGFNVKKAPFGDSKVRQALSHAINKEELVQIALGGIGQAAFAPLAPTLPGFNPSLKSFELGYNVEKAKSLLKESGFSAGSDGMLTKDGQPFKVTLLTSTRAPNPALATVLQSQLKAVGVPVDIQQLEAAAAQDAMTTGSYDLMLWRYDWNDADVLDIYLSSARIGSTNRNFYSNPKVDQLLSQAGSEMDPVKSNTSYLQAQQLILQDAVWQPLYTPQDFVAIRKDVSNVVMGPMGRMLLNDAIKK